MSPPYGAGFIITFTGGARNHADRYKPGDVLQRLSEFSHRFIRSEMLDRTFPFFSDGNPATVSMMNNQ